MIKQARAELLEFMEQSGKTQTQIARETSLSTATVSQFLSGTYNGDNEKTAAKGNFTITTSEHEVETYRMGADSIEDNIRVLEEYGAMLDALKVRGADNDTMNEIIVFNVAEFTDEAEPDTPYGTSTPITE